MSERITVSTTDSQGYADCLEKIKLESKTPLHFLHAPFYGQWQEKAGKKVVYFVVQEDKTPLGCGMAISYNLPGGFYYFYCPYGPLLTKWTPAATEAIKKFFKDNFKDSKLLFVRLDANDMPHAALKTPSDAATATSSLQPRNEWVLDISPAPEELLANMHKKARYHIKLAERNNARFRTESCTPEKLDTFYNLMVATSERDKFHLLPKSYYESAFEILLKADSARLAFVDIDGKPAAANLCITYEGQMHYVFGCSSNEFRRIGPSYFLQWNSILKSKEGKAVKLYNFGGVSDEIKSTHLQGVTRFKERFGGFKVSHGKPADIIMSPLTYRLFAFYKSLQRLR